MEKTCAAEKNRTTDNMWVEKKGKKRKKGEKKGGGGEAGGSTQNRKEPYDVLKRT